MSSPDAKMSAWLFAGLVAAGGYQLFKRRVWPEAVTLLWYAYSALPSTADRQRRAR